MENARSKDNIPPGKIAQLRQARQLQYIMSMKETTIPLAQDI
jgi:hypothetical protein